MKILLKNWIFILFLFYFYFLFYLFLFFENLLLKIEPLEIIPVFYNNFFGLGGGISPLATPLLYIVYSVQLSYVMWHLFQEFNCVSFIKFYSGPVGLGLNFFENQVGSGLKFFGFHRVWFGNLFYLVGSGSELAVPAHLKPRARNHATNRFP